MKKYKIKFTEEFFEDLKFFNYDKIFDIKITNIEYNPETKMCEGIVTCPSISFYYSEGSSVKLIINRTVWAGYIQIDWELVR